MSKPLHRYRQRMVCQRCGKIREWLCNPTAPLLNGQNSVYTVTAWCSVACLDSLGRH